MNHHTAVSIALVSAGASVLLLPLTLPVVGFGAGGVVAGKYRPAMTQLIPGSVAAGIQSAVYGGTTGGVFAVAQSIGAAGLAGTTVGGAVASVLTGAGILVVG